ncbi:hypothetical protein WOLCODRAFT_19544 [Wolfiporia cocos MD-104 SS10]|uniref:Uncharacterized protein n=1 Tax=Wolfiporia cocos (strain MD-104) TaxID=742152 RepID=A0A2H3IYC4_WOLCO|nr:hypothetical protein WOLCODRAFT_19544 [Wolfiporia cocos MD-104 SS10]
MVPVSISSVITEAAAVAAQGGNEGTRTSSLSVMSLSDITVDAYKAAAADSFHQSACINDEFEMWRLVAQISVAAIVTYICKVASTLSREGAYEVAERGEVAASNKAISAIPVMEVLYFCPYTGMMFRFSLAFILASSAVGIPTYPKLPARQAADPCAGLAGNVTDDAVFLLAALNTTLPNANATGVPLVLGSNGTDYGIIVTYASYPESIFPQNITLTEGDLTLLSSSDYLAYDVSVNAGYGLNFLLVDLQPGPDGLPGADPIYCVQEDVSPAILAVNGDAESFSLCETLGGGPAQKAVIWKANSENGGVYNYTSCYPVILQLVAD